MIKINTALKVTSSYATFAQASMYAQRKDNTAWQPYQNEKELRMVIKALDWIRDNAANDQGCSGYFLKLPAKRTLADLFTSSELIVTISRDPSGPGAGETAEGSLGITVSSSSFRTHSALCATLVHEMSHCCGATDVDAQAETALKHCKLKSQFVEGNSVTREQQYRPIRKR